MSLDRSPKRIKGFSCERQIYSLKIPKYVRRKRFIFVPNLCLLSAIMLNTYTDLPYIAHIPACSYDKWGLFAEVFLVGNYRI